MYLQPSLAHISSMPQQTFEQIVEKYVFRVFVVFTEDRIDCALKLA